MESDHHHAGIRVYPRTARLGGSLVLTSNRAVSKWGVVFGDPVVATAILDMSRRGQFLMSLDTLSVPSIRAPH